MRTVAVSPSPWRAWIEICDISLKDLVITSRPPRGGRGLKFAVRSPVTGVPALSPSPWRAWIEMVTREEKNIYRIVALPTEGLSLSQQKKFLSNSPLTHLPITQKYVII